MTRADDERAGFEQEPRAEKGRAPRRPDWVSQNAWESLEPSAQAALADAVTEARSRDEYSVAQLVALRNYPEWRRAAVMHEIRCGRCGDLVAEVVKLAPAPVLLYRSSAQGQSIADLRRLSPTESLNAILPLRRSDSWRLSPVVWPLPSVDIHHHVMPIMCRCRQLTLDMNQVYTDLRDARPKRVLS
jgi:hypothetical protein